MYCGENHLLDLTVAQTERVLAVVVKIQSDIRLRSRTVVRKMNVDALLPGVPITQTGECPGSLTTRGSVGSHHAPPAAVAGGGCRTVASICDYLPLPNGIAIMSSASSDGG